MTTTRQKKRLGSVHFVGAGPGDPELLTVRAAALLERADVLVFDRCAREAFLRFCRPDVEIVDGAEGRPPTRRADVARQLVTAAKEGRQVVRLVDGDPLLFGGVVDEVEACAKAHVGFELVPGVPTASSVALYAGVPLVPKRGREVRVVDLEVGVPDWPAPAATTTLVVVNPLAAPGKLAAGLLERGYGGDTPVAVTVCGTTTAQRTVVTTLDRLEADTAGLEAQPPAVAVVGDAVRGRDRLSWFETKPLFGWKVLVPRTREQAATLSDQLRSYGAVPVEVPTIAVEPPRTPAPMDRAIKGLVSGRYQWVAFTSVNAVRAVREKFEELGLDARAFAGVKTAVVGEMTGAALEAWGIKPDLVPPAEQSSEGLLSGWPAYDPVLDALDRVFLPRADIATDTLVAGLKDLGWAVDDVTAYRTVRAAPPPAEIRDAIKSGGFDAALFTSSSTVRNLVGIAGKPHPTTVIAVIGPQTAQTAEELGLRVDVMAPAASVTALAEALADYGDEHRTATDGEPPGKANRRAPVKVKRAK